MEKMDESAVPDQGGSLLLASSSPHGSKKLKLTPPVDPNSMLTVELPTPCIAKCRSGKAEMILGKAANPKPLKRVNVKLRCPCDPASPISEWLCPNCTTYIEYGFDGKFYCECGSACVNSFIYKCPSTSGAHDGKGNKAFVQYLGAELGHGLGQLVPRKELNILIMGETGVGKSTWINGFVNFLTYENLDAAEEEDELITLIPSEFTICDKEFNRVTVSSGMDKNEGRVPGQSATQECRVYPFPVGQTMIVKLIDTPGIGDTRGEEWDKKNLENILDTLSTVGDVHGICILLKPNNARLTLTFRFCIKELLTYLHRDAIRNIVFCFTNSRGTFYRPGDTMVALEQLLKENRDVQIVLNPKTIYCFDSEAYRFLAAVKNPLQPIEFTEEERENFAKSWEISSHETTRLLDYFASLNPHPTQSTLNLNYARELVIKLAAPLAMNNRNLNLNMGILQQRIHELQQTNANTEDLKKKKRVPRVGLKVIQLPFPKTVCTNSRCTKTYLQVDGTTVTEYVQICHDHCYLKGVPQNSINNSKLLRCWAMAGRNSCQHPTCNHSYMEHMHIYYDTEQELHFVEDHSVMDMIQKNVSAAEIKQAMIDNTRQEIDTLKSELKEIEKASISFAGFLKLNSITPYNDAMLEYLDHLIREEKHKVSIGADDSTLQMMENYRLSYQEQIRILDLEMSRDGHRLNIMNKDDVERAVGNLRSLKSSGKYINDALNALKQVQPRSYEEVQVRQNVYKYLGIPNLLRRGIQGVYRAGQRAIQPQLRSGSLYSRFR